MTYNIYTVHDKVMGSYMAPFIMINEEAAKREFKIMCTRKPEIAEDLTLWKLGTFEDETGTIVGKMPEMITFGKE